MGARQVLGLDAVRKEANDGGARRGGARGVPPRVCVGGGEGAGIKIQSSGS